MENKAALRTVIVMNEGTIESEMLSTDHYWRQSITTAESIATAEPTNEPNVDEIDSDNELHPDAVPIAKKAPKVFSCPEIGCVKSFQKYSNLLSHLDVGRHVRMAERETLLDTAMHMYGSSIESIRSIPNLIPFREAAESLALPSTASYANLQKGWALRQNRATTRFTSEQRQYLLDKFDEGARLKQKFDARRLSETMR